MKLLEIQASARRNGSISRLLSQEFIVKLTVGKSFIDRVIKLLSVELILIYLFKSKI